VMKPIFGDGERTQPDHDRGKYVRSRSLRTSWYDKERMESEKTKLLDEYNV
jgi:hypothetical protein